MLLAALVFAQTLDVTGFVVARGVSATGPASWLEEDFGRLDESGGRDQFVGMAHAGAAWQPAKWLTLHASGVARSDARGDHAGIVEAYADLRRELAFDEIRVRAGYFFLPTSKENRDDQWASPYTIRFSALNTWIGQEVRPLGADVQYRHTTHAGQTITGGATAFRGNDTMGALLAWRGWSMGDRLTTYGEVLPLPPLGSVSDRGPFFRQRDDGTQPFGPDLDGHTGWSARVRYGVPQRGDVQYTIVDNGGDRELYGDEYSWKTRFHIIGAELGDPDRLAVAAEHLFGRTDMGPPPSPDFVAATFRATYLLVSHKRGRNRWSARYDLFHSADVDRTLLGENNDESGHAWTLTWMVDFAASLRGALELAQVTGDRPAAQQYGFDPSTRGRSVALEARYRF